MPQKGNEWSNKKGKKNRSVKVHGGEVKQSPFERQTKECGEGYGGTVDERKRESGRQRYKLCKHSGCPKRGPSPTFLKNDPASLRFTSALNQTLG